MADIPNNRAGHLTHKIMVRLSDTMSALNHEESIMDLDVETYNRVFDHIYSILNAELVNPRAIVIGSGVDHVTDLEKILVELGHHNPGIIAIATPDPAIAPMEELKKEVLMLEAPPIIEQAPHIFNESKPHNDRNVKRYHSRSKW